MESKDLTSCDIYSLAESKLKSFTRSAVRTKVMLCLLKGEMSSGDLEKLLGSSATTILHTIKDLIEENLVAKSSRGYILTNVGRIQALILEELLGTLIVLDRHHDFWLTHDLSGLPIGLQMKIGMLGKGEILKGNPAAILRTQEYFISELKKAKEIHGVSPIIVPGYAEAIVIAVANGAQVDLILTDNILDIVLKEYRDVIQDLLHHENFSLFSIDNNIKVAFTVTDSILSFGLFRADGVYDVSSDLNCIGPEAYEWGMELFAYYISKSKHITSV